MPTTYEAIATVTVGSGGAANIEFTSIPATYTDLHIVASLRINGGSEADGFTLQFNNNSTGYTQRRLFGSGSTVTSDTATAALWVNGNGSTASTFSNVSVYIPNYAGSTNKSYSNDGVSENNGTTAYAALVAGLWSNTAAITSIKITPSSNSLVQHSTATLYGIKNS